MLASAARRAVRQTAQSVHFPAPRGLNRILPAGQMPLERGILLYNLIGAEYGNRVRLGYREWVTGLTGAADNQVRSVLPFMGSDSSKSKLFACTSSGIWDVTSSTAAPAALGSVTTTIAFADTTGNAGWGVCHTFVNTAGNHFLIYCDEVNGMYVYTESTTTWAKVAMGGGAAEVSGVDPASFVHVAGFKQRLWFTQRNSAQAWYLSAGALYGAATQFNFGSKFKSGGGLRGLWNLTYDGGGGMDDSLVAVSDGGDVAIYQGLDPSSATSFNIKGVWSVGAIPAGRRLVSDFGGDLLILSKSGAIPASRLVAGKDVDRSQYTTNEISPLFNQYMLSSSTLKGWSLRLHPEENALIVTVPTTDGAATTQLVLSLATEGWSQYRSLPIYSDDVWDGKLYFGTVDGKICINDGYLDGVTLADPNVYSDITWASLSSFQNFGNANQKQVQTIRTSILCDGGVPSYGAAAHYRYDFSELGSIAAGTVGGNTWDNGLFDTATWGGEYATTQALSGAAGMGPEFAIAAKGTARARTVLIGFDVTFTQGGLL